MPSELEKNPKKEEKNAVTSAAQYDYSSLLGMCSRWASPAAGSSISLPREGVPEGHDSLGLGESRVASSKICLDGVGIFSEPINEDPYFECTSSIPLPLSSSVTFLLFGLMGLVDLEADKRYAVELLTFFEARDPPTIHHLTSTRRFGQPQSCGETSQLQQPSISYPASLGLGQVP